MSHVTIASADAPSLSRLRSRARSIGLRIEKGRGQLHTNNHGGLQLIDAERNIVAYGADYELSIETATEIVDELTATRRNASAA